LSFISKLPQAVREMAGRKRLNRKAAFSLIVFSLLQEAVSFVRAKRDCIPWGRYEEEASGCHFRAVMMY